MGKATMGAKPAFPIKGASLAEEPTKAVSNGESVPVAA